MPKIKNAFLSFLWQQESSAEEAETFSVGEEVTGTLLRYDSERQAWILNRQ